MYKCMIHHVHLIWLKEQNIYKNLADRVCLSVSQYVQKYAYSKFIWTKLFDRKLDSNFIRKI